MKGKMQQYFNTKYDSALFMNQNYIEEEKATIHQFIYMVKMNYILVLIVIIYC